MSFQINWSAFASQSDFQHNIRELLTNALNKNQPHILEDKIELLNLDWGAEAPSLELLEVGDMASDRFRGVFKLNYSGGATITVSTKIQANLLRVSEKGSPNSFITPKYVGASSSFPIPINLTLRKIKLQGTVIVVFSKSRGLTIVFRNDPLQSIEVSSTFDNFPLIANFLQQQIAAQIRTLFREEVPSVLYQLSLKYLPNISGLPKQLDNKNTAAKVKFEDLECDGPVSLINVLRLEALLNKSRSLGLDKINAPTSILRSQLSVKTSKALPPAAMLNISEGGDSVYKQIYLQSKQSKSKASRNYKRRVLKIKKKDDMVSEDEAILDLSLVDTSADTVLVESIPEEENNDTLDQIVPTNTTEEPIREQILVPSKVTTKLESQRNMDIDRIAAEILLKRLQKRLGSGMKFGRQHAITQMATNHQIPHTFHTLSQAGISELYPFPIYDLDTPPPAYNA